MSLNAVGPRLHNGVQHATLNINAVGTDGSHLQFHENTEAAMNAGGTITVSFDHLTCGG